MRLLDLHLRAYAPFTDRRIDISGESEGLHLALLARLAPDLLGRSTRRSPVCTNASASRGGPRADSMR
jgi:hypothetical protein